MKNKLAMAIHNKLRDCLFCRVRKIFDDDEVKTATWFLEPNPMLGGMEPIIMIRNGQAARLEQFIVEAEYQNDAA